MGLEARRSPRVALNVPLRVQSENSAGNAHTAVVNRHGALILCPMQYAEGTQVDVWNLRTGDHARARVAWYGGQDLPGLHKEGIELIDYKPAFWGPEYDQAIAG